MELKHLQTFLTLSEIKNFTKTAEQLHYAQSNITSQIQQLEKELNVRLFERIGKSVALTSAGQELVPYAKKMLNLSKDIEMKFSNKSSGRLTIGASESICIYRLPAIIKTFRQLHPSIEIYLKVLDTPDFISLLGDNSIDIAFTLDIPIQNPNIITTLKIEEPVHMWALPSHPLINKKHVSIHDLQDLPLILTSKSCCYRKQFERELNEASITPKILLETGSLQVIKQTVLSGLGACILPQLAVQKELSHNELVQINCPVHFNIVSQLIYHKDKWLSDALKDFIEISKEITKKDQR